MKPQRRRDASTASTPSPAAARSAAQRAATPLAFSAGMNARASTPGASTRAATPAARNPRTPAAGSAPRMTPQEARDLVSGKLPHGVIEARIDAARGAAARAESRQTEDTSGRLPPLSPIASSPDALTDPTNVRSHVTEGLAVDAGGVRAEGYMHALETSAQLAEVVARRAARERELQRRGDSVYQIDRFGDLSSQVTELILGPGGSLEQPPGGSDAPGTSPNQPSRSPSPETDPTTSTDRANLQRARRLLVSRAEADALKSPDPTNIDDRVLKRHRTGQRQETSRYGLSKREAQRWIEKGILDEEDIATFGDGADLMRSKAEVHRVVYQRDVATRDFVFKTLGSWAGGILSNVDRNDHFEAILIELQETLEDSSKLPIELVEELMRRLDVSTEDEAYLRMVNQLDPRQKGEIQTSDLRSYWHRSELSMSRRKITLAKATEALEQEFPHVKTHSAASAAVADRKPIPFHTFIAWLGRMGAKIEPEDAAPVFTQLQPLTRARALSDPLFSEVQALVQRIRSEQAESTNDLALARRLQEVDNRTAEAMAAFDTFQNATENSVTAQRKLNLVHDQLRSQAVSAAALGRLAPVKVFYSASSQTDVALDDGFTELWEGVMQQVRGGSALATRGLPSALEMKEQKLQSVSASLRTTAAELVETKSRLEATVAKLRTLQQETNAERDVMTTQREILEQQVKQLSEGPGVTFADPRFTTQVSEEVNTTLTQLKQKLRSQVVDHTVAIQKALKEAAMYRQREEETQQTVVVLKHRIDKIKSDMAADIEGLEEQVKARDEVISKQRAEAHDAELQFIAVEHKLEQTAAELAAECIKRKEYEEQVERLLRMQKSLVPPAEVERRIKGAVNEVKLELGAETESREALQNDLNEMRKQLNKTREKQMEMQSSLEQSKAKTTMQLSMVTRERDTAKEALRSLLAGWVDSVCHARTIITNIHDIDDCVAASQDGIRAMLSSAEDAIKGIDESGSILEDVGDVTAALLQLLADEQSAPFPDVGNHYTKDLATLRSHIDDLSADRDAVTSRLTSVEEEKTRLEQQDENMMAAVRTLGQDLEEVLSGQADTSFGGAWEPQSAVEEHEFPAVAGQRWARSVQLLSGRMLQTRATVKAMRDAIEDTERKADMATVAASVRSQLGSMVANPSATFASPSAPGAPRRRTRAEEAALDPNEYAGAGTSADPKLITAPDAVFNSLHQTVARHETATARMLSTMTKLMSSEDSERRARVRSVLHAKIRNAVSRVRERVAVAWIERSAHLDAISRQHLVMDAHALFDADRADTLDDAVSLVLVGEDRIGKTDEDKQLAEPLPRRDHPRPRMPKLGSLANVDARSRAVAETADRSPSDEPVTEPAERRTTKTGNRKTGASGAATVAAAKKGASSRARSPLGSSPPQSAPLSPSQGAEKPPRGSSKPSSRSGSMIMPRGGSPEPVTVATKSAECQTRLHGAVVSEADFSKLRSRVMQLEAGVHSSESEAARLAAEAAAEMATHNPAKPAPLRPSEYRAPVRSLPKSVTDTECQTEPLQEVTPESRHTVTVSPLGGSEGRIPKRGAVASHSVGVQVSDSSQTDPAFTMRATTTPSQGVLPSAEGAAGLKRAFSAGAARTKGMPSQSTVRQPLRRPTSSDAPKPTASAGAAGTAAQDRPPTGGKRPQHESRASSAGSTSRANRNAPESSRSKRPDSATSATSLIESVTSMAELTSSDPAAAGSKKPVAVRESVAAVLQQRHAAAAAADQPSVEQKRMSTAAKAEVEATRVSIRGAMARFRSYVHRQLFPLHKVDLEIDENAAGLARAAIPFEAIEALSNALPEQYRLPGVRYLLLAMLSGLSRSSFQEALRKEHFVPPFFAAGVPTAMDLDLLYEGAVLCGEILVLGRYASGKLSSQTNARSPRAASPGAGTGLIERPMSRQGRDEAAHAHDVAVRQVNIPPQRVSSASGFRRPYSATSVGGSSAGGSSTVVPAVTAEQPLQDPAPAPSILRASSDHTSTDAGDTEVEPLSTAPPPPRSPPSKRDVPSLTHTTYGAAALPQGGAVRVANATRTTAASRSERSTNRAGSPEVLDVLGAISRQHEMLSKTRAALNDTHGRTSGKT